MARFVTFLKTRFGNVFPIGLYETNRTYTSVSICDLPVEVLDYIFSYLSVKERLRTEMVCRQWREMGKTFLWSWPTKLDVRRDLKENYKIRIPTDKILPSVLSRCGRNLKRLVVSYEDSRTKFKCKILSVIGENCPNLVEIRLNISIEDENPELSLNLNNLATKCPKLKEIWLGNPVGNSIDFNVFTIIEFLKLCPSVDCLVLRDFYMISDELVNTLNQKLKGLYIGCCMHRPSFEIFAEKLMERCDCIEGLALANDYYNHLTLTTVIKLVNFYYGLQRLYLVHLDLREWQINRNTLQHLEALSLLNSGISDNFLKLLVDNCQKLQALDVRGCDITDIGIGHLADAPLLRVLDVSRTQMKGDGMRRVIEKGRLEKLRMEGVQKTLVDTPSVTDKRWVEDTCILLANCCHNLHLLDVSRNKYIGNRLVREFCSSVERGFLKNPVTLFVWDTKVTKGVKCCDRLAVSFKYQWELEGFDHLQVYPFCVG